MNFGKVSGRRGINKPENQDDDALGKIEQQDFVILDLTLRVFDSA